MSNDKKKLMLGPEENNLLETKIGKIKLRKKIENRIKCLKTKDLKMEAGATGTK
jgi:hypothetical protein